MRTIFSDINTSFTVLYGAEGLVYITAFYGLPCTCYDVLVMMLISPSSQILSWICRCETEFYKKIFINTYAFGTNPLYIYSRNALQLVLEWLSINIDIDRDGFIDRQLKQFLPECCLWFCHWTLVLRSFTDMMRLFGCVPVADQLILTLNSSRQENGLWPNSPAGCKGIHIDIARVDPWYSIL